MVEQQYEVLWNTTARNQVKKIYNYIEKESVPNAKKLVKEIIDRKSVV